MQQNTKKAVSYALKMQDLNNLSNCSWGTYRVNEKITLNDFAEHITYMIKTKIRLEYLMQVYLY